MTVNSNWTAGIAAVIGIALIVASLPLASIAIAAIGVAAVAEAVWMRSGHR